MQLVPLLRPLYRMDRFTWKLLFEEKKRVPAYKKKTHSITIDTYFLIFEKNSWKLERKNETLIFQLFGKKVVIPWGIPFVFFFFNSNNQISWKGWLLHSENTTSCLQVKKEKVTLNNSEDHFIFLAPSDWTNRVKVSFTIFWFSKKYIYKGALFLFL